MNYPNVPENFSQSILGLAEYRDKQIQPLLADFDAA